MQIENFRATSPLLHTVLNSDTFSRLSCSLLLDRLSTLGHCDSGSGTDNDDLMSSSGKDSDSSSVLHEVRYRRITASQDDSRKALHTSASEPSPKMDLRISSSEPSPEMNLSISDSEPSLGMSLRISNSEPSQEMAMRTNNWEPSPATDWRFSNPQSSRGMALRVSN